MSKPDEVDNLRFAYALSETYVERLEAKIKVLERINPKDLHNTIIESVNKALRHDHPEMSPNRSELEYFKAGIRWMAKGVAMEARVVLNDET